MWDFGFGILGFGIFDVGILGFYDFFILELNLFADSMRVIREREML